MVYYKLLSLIDELILYKLRMNANNAEFMVTKSVSLGE